MSKRTRRTFSQEFKQQIVNLYLAGKPRVEIIREYHMKVAIVGCGNIAATHAKALIQQNQEIVLVIGRDQSKAKAFAEIWNIPSHSNQFTDALASSVDCIHICTPPAMHYEMAKAALLAGKHVICEKPLCLNSEQARELYQLAEERGLLAAVNFNVRYHEACQQGRKIVPANAQSHDTTSDFFLSTEYFLMVYLPYLPFRSHTRPHT